MRTRYGAATALLALDGNRIATLDFRGPVTPGVLDAARRDYIQWAAKHRAHAVVTRLDRAVCLFGHIQPPTDLTPAEIRVLSQIVHAVVAPDKMESFERFCGAAAEQGMHRRVFATYAPALAWATKIGLALRPFDPPAPVPLRVVRAGEARAQTIEP